ncbi:hypothetical protein C2S53_011201 [Perilla frutescens var. hirtella]|uniref:Uncharacterized protein n=1 Tax=Perilla frutescens var. hirtella TaxID=608512 RepID=A0AAD4IN92_PERFH|nr:hypothetical protein C2S53_011201 [Perilla frutescens var. hirtella]
MAKPSRYQAEFHDRYGIVIPYLQKFVFEDEEQFDYGPYYESDEDIYSVAEPHETILKYIKQIRDSFGFDVDCRAPSWFDGPFTPVNLADAKHNMKKTYNDAMESAHFAIREINAETSGKTYEFVELKKVVLTMNFLRLLTITLKNIQVRFLTSSPPRSDQFMIPFLAVCSPSGSRSFLAQPYVSKKSLEDYIKKVYSHWFSAISQGSLKSLQDDQRKVLLTIIKDETEEKSKGLLDVLKAAASANRDLIFGYVGIKQWEDFAESFEVDKKTELPRLVVWDSNVDYYAVHMATQVSRFLKDYREGRVIQKRINGPSLLTHEFKTGAMLLLLDICIVLVVVLIVAMVKDKPLNCWHSEQVVEGRSSALQPESTELLRPFNKVMVPSVELLNSAIDFCALTKTNKVIVASVETFEVV